MPPRPFEHQDADRKPDEALRAEARAHLGATPHLQLVAELLGRLRALDLPWWTPELQLAPQPRPSAPPPAMAAPVSGPRAVSAPPPALVPSPLTAPPSARYDAPPASVATARNEGAARAAAAAAILAAMPSARGSAATLLDALADIPGEEERTNPRDIPSDDSSVDNEETGGAGAARRDATFASGKRKRHGKS